MAYDRERKEQIDGMGVADLIHTMLIEFDTQAPGKAPCFQSTAYFWAHERLAEMLPPPQEAAPAVSDGGGA